ncbi:MAG: glycyl radical protein [Melioribacteraceae bacterium]|nr:glycyl radical protein [Melioribacteraceae bacterium]MCF8265474.1 glycyl radical protein [Melioribacteraceae bacterium]MCF8431107.1 glycyl radical protein [Melioribacteraceae bacterium]
MLEELNLVDLKDSVKKADTKRDKTHTYSERISKLRELSCTTQPSLSIERAIHQTEFYKENLGKYSMPVLRAKAFYDHCRRKTIYIGENELIVGERGPKPNCVPTFPELTCHSVEDLRVLNTRSLQRYTIGEHDIQIYKNDVIPFWKGKTLRERIFQNVPENWKKAYHSGLFTEFMEQRAPGHTALDGKIYSKGMTDFKREIEQNLEALDFLNDPDATDKAEEWKAMIISCDAVILFAERHAELAIQLAEKENNSLRKLELKRIAEVCTHVPKYSPRNLWEAIQMYWFVHLGTITELNGWDAMNPGHFDHHLLPFYQKEINHGLITREYAKELLSCFWIKVNNHPAPPKVGITAKESGTYNDFTNINIGGILKDGSDGVNELSYMMLEIIDELHLLQPGNSVHISSVTPDPFIKQACEVIRSGYGYPSLFNPDIYVQELTRQGKSLEDAREGGCSGCIEVGAFGKEAYILTGYLNLPKVLEITLNNGIDPLNGERVGIETGDPAGFRSFDQLYEAFRIQLNYIIDLKMSVSNYIDKMFSKYAPAPFLSVVIDDCISKGQDYYSGGARYNTNYIQCCGLGTITDSFAALKKHVFATKRFSLEKIIKSLSNNFENDELTRQFIFNKTPFFGNDDEYADSIAVKIYNTLFDLIDGKPNIKNGKYHLNMLSTTCHVYFGKVLGASPNGRFAGKPISDGTSPSHGADKNGPSAVVKSLSKLDQTKSGGTLLNQRFLPSLLERESDLEKLGDLIKSYFKLGGHHIQFNVVDNSTLRMAQDNPEDFGDLMVRVAGYSDYFNDLHKDLKQEIIERTENEAI